MKNTTAQKRLSKINIENTDVYNIINSIVNSDMCIGLSYSICRSLPSIQFFKCNTQYILFDELIKSLGELGLKVKSSINNIGFDIKITNIEYEKVH